MCASRSTNQRKPTPCTRPRTTKRLACTSAVIELNQNNSTTHFRTTAGCGWRVSGTNKNKFSWCRECEVCLVRDASDLYLVRYTPPIPPHFAKYLESST